MTDHSSVLEVSGLTTSFQTMEGWVRAVDEVSFSLGPGETLGLVGESGCGKSVTALSILRLITTPPGRIEAGEVWLKKLNLLDLPLQRMRGIRGNRVSMIFQEPMTSLNPVYPVGDQISEALVIHHGLSRREAWAEAVAMLAKVQIPSPERRAQEYPHQLSGGMRQRAMIAMALACRPEVLLADEPTTALDVTIQAQILDLMLALQAELGTAILMITHDLGVIAELARRVVVMYAGQVVEEGTTLELFDQPRHPYTQGLLRSIPRLGRRSRLGRERLLEIKGVVPSLLDLPPGCFFNPRCDQARPLCRERRPELVELGPGRRVRCWLEAG